MRPIPQRCSSPTSRRQRLLPATSRHRQPGAQRLHRPHRPARVESARLRATRSRKLRGIADPGTTDAHVVQDGRLPGAQGRRRPACAPRQAGHQPSSDVANNLLVVAVVERPGGALVLPEPAQQRELHRWWSRRRRSPSWRRSKGDVDAAHRRTPIASATAGGADSPGRPSPEAPAQILSGIAQRHARRQGPERISRCTVQRVIDVGASTSRGAADLGRGRQPTSRRKIDALGKLPPAMRLTLREQNQVMRTPSAAWGSASSWRAAGLLPDGDPVPVLLDPSSSWWRFRVP